MHKGLKVIISEEAKCNLVWKFIASAHWFYCEYYNICCQPMLSYKINKQQGKSGLFRTWTWQEHNYGKDIENYLNEYNKILLNTVNIFSFIHGSYHIIQ